MMSRNAGTRQGFGRNDPPSSQASRARTTRSYRIGERLHSLLMAEVE